MAVKLGKGKVAGINSCANNGRGDRRGGNGPARVAGEVHREGAGTPGDRRKTW